MAKVLVVVDMQNDFLTGALENQDAVKIVPYVKKKIEEEKKNGTTIIFTRDTHKDDYMETEEGRNLPVPHCIHGTEGWEIIKELEAEKNATLILNKETFGSMGIADYFKNNQKLMYAYGDHEAGYDEIELIGVCTDICVISNALLIKAFMPNARISVDAAGCAGVTPDAHDTALKAMEACHVEIKNKGQEAWRA